MSQNEDVSDLKEDYPSQLRDSLRCHILLKLLLQLPHLKIIPRVVFEHMPLLEVLDLSSTSIQSLPSSISCLSSLKELHLRDCSFLIELPIEIGMLTKLKLLDMEGSEIMYIPKEIVEITDLEVLRLCLSRYAENYIKAKNVNGGAKVPRMMISELKKLKKLCISVCQEAEWWEKEIKEIQDEICNLENLEFLKWFLPTAATLKQFLDIQINRNPAYEKLSNFTITIGQHAQLTSCLPRDLEKKFAEFEKCLKWINAEGNIYDISKIMTRAKALFLSRHWTIVNLSTFDISKLKYFLLAECNEMETLVKIDDLSEVVENNKNSGLESLEYLGIHYMEKLKSIWEGPIGKDSLSRLRILAMHTCLELTTIFTPRMAQNLSCLVELTVEECPKVKSLISTPYSEHGLLFPSLEKIFLIDLPELDHIFGDQIVLEKLKSLMIYNCVKLRRLSKTELPHIQKIKGENKWWNSLYEYTPTWENVFEPLKEKSKLIEQLLEATNSLQHFHHVVSRAKDEKPLDGPGLGAQETETDPYNFSLRKEEGLIHTLPEAKDEKSFDGPGLEAQETKTDPSNFPLRKEEGPSHTLPGTEILQNGDVYIGDVKDMIPHGTGTYTWSNGTFYEGDWENGKMTGSGRITWSSGSSYEGDFSGGYLHGVGTRTNRDGSIYVGSWILNTQHGFGRKEYSNSDIYDGSWKVGVHEGIGKYAWSNGDMYIGNWKGGLMCGRGVMKWVNGDLYDGSWSNGYCHGSGVYRFADGSYYFGIWTNGLKDGRGTFYPAGSRCRYSQRLGKKDVRKDIKRTITRRLSRKVSISVFKRDSHQRSSKRIVMEEDGNIHDSILENTDILSHTSDQGESEADVEKVVICDREYVQGVLIKESTNSDVGLSYTREQQRKYHRIEVKKKSPSERFDGIKSYYLMLNLQLGIRYSIGKTMPNLMREAKHADFGKGARIKVYFPRKGSQLTPPHSSINFHWKDYCPTVFRNLREMFNIDAADYMMSICSGDGLRELSSLGNSGSLFYASLDDKFVIKTLRTSELKVLLKMLPNYYNHVSAHENTLVTKFYGLHEISVRGGKKVQFVVMGNMFYTDLRIHRRYDLKGSCRERNTNKDDIREHTTFKDLDLTYDFHMDKSVRDAFFKQIYLDCAFLESQQIIDYSLLLGLHFRAPKDMNALLEPPDAFHMPRKPNAGDDDGLTDHMDCSIPPKGLLLVTHEPSSVNTAPVPHSRGSTLKAFSVGDKEVDILLPGTARLRVQLGVNMPAQANRRVSTKDDSTSTSTEAELFDVYDVVLYLGVIDILQGYNTRKKIELAYKSMRHDPMSISVADPRFYSKRFYNFLEKVFPADT